MLGNHSVRVRAALSIAVATAALVSEARAATEYYFGGYDTGTSTQGTPTVPVSSPLTVSGQITVYQDAAGTTPYGAGVGPASANTTDLILGGDAGAANYTVQSPTGNTTIHAIVLNSNNGGTNTLNFNFAGSNRYSMASLPSGDTSNFGTGITLRGNSNWSFTNGGGGSGPLRAQNSFSISGNGTGTLTIPFNLANASGTPSMTVNLTGGGTLVLSTRNDFSGSGGTPSFTLAAGTVDFGNSRSFGGLNAQIRLNGGTLLSSNGSTIDNGYVGNGGTAGEAPLRIGGNVTFAGSTAWGTGNNLAVLINGNRTITANNSSATGTTIGGAIGDGGNAYSLSVAAASTGRLTLAGANAFSGGVNVNGGTLVTANNAALGTGATTVTAGTLKVGNGTSDAVAGLSGLSIASGATLELGGADSSVALASGVFTLGNATLDLNNFFNAAGTYTLIKAANVAGNAIGTTSFVDADTANYTYAFGVDATTGNGVLTVTSNAVPEPASLAALGVASLLFVRRSRRA